MPTEPSNNYISKVQLPGSNDIYYIKDEWCRSQLGISLGLVVVQSLPLADNTTTGKIYLVPHTHSNDNNLDPQTNTSNSYDEYITIDNGSDANPRYVWEKIGTTDINLSGYSVVGHHHTYTKITGVQAHTFTVAPTVTISQGTGDANYTPKGTISITTNPTQGAHTHTFTQNIQYLQKRSVVQYLGTQTVVKGINTSNLQITDITPTDGTQTVSKATFSSNKDYAKAGSNVQFNAMGTVTSRSVLQYCNKVQNLRADGNLGTQTWTRTDNTPMWGAQVVQETLMFSFKPLSTSQTVTDLSKGSWTAQQVAKSQQNIIPAVAQGSLQTWSFEDHTVALAGSSIQVATGQVQEGGSGATVATSITGQTVTVAADPHSTSVYNGISTSDTSGTSVVRSVQGVTSSAGDHHHEMALQFNGQAVQLVAETTAQTITISHVLQSTTDNTSVDVAP